MNAYGLYSTFVWTGLFASAVGLFALATQYPGAVWILAAAASFQLGAFVVSFAADGEDDES